MREQRSRITDLVQCPASLVFKYKACEGELITLSNRAFLVKGNCGCKMQRGKVWTSKKGTAGTIHGVL